MKLFGYITFLLKSSNQHGIHSPFVFNWITQGLYSKNSNWDALPQKEVFTERVFAYFKPKTVAWISTKAVPVKISGLSIFFPSLDSMRESATTVQMIYIDESCLLPATKVIETLLVMGNDAFVLVDKRAATAELNALWDQLIRNDKTTVSMDFYFYGLVFIRKEQLKQHFRIRL
ncbi:hypothetical protein [Flavobacterium sp. NKUCC04_CG]|uniref:hypothetical protein n=1 Tax=Flavobacterium sp. NKUCC04_CG TaxID=2842121 RepID=UPI001C5B617F|nr:hypothetical protein [Flavobacterium sp. NKUCC04_CG]MBW3519487.1 hypothetical protein [Flavobacterium sp. NKUCC04_CG]